MNKLIWFNCIHIYRKILIFLLCFFCCNYVKGVQLSGKKLSLQLRNVPIKVVFKSIEKQTGYIFTYNNDQFDENIKVSINKDSILLEDLIQYVLSGTNFTYSINDYNNIILQRKESYQDDGSFEIDSSTYAIGVVKDELGHPLSGVSVIVKGTNLGGITDINGEFVIKNFPKNGVLMIKLLGYLTEEFVPEAKKRKNITVFLKKYINNLDEQVVAAYRNVTQRTDVGGGISTLSAERIEKKPVSNVLLALQGEVPGVYINQSTGYSNSGVVVQIRGQNSLSNGNMPLYVVDGVPFTSTLMPGVNTFMLGSSGKTFNGDDTYGNPLSFINPSDIESISVLKDADATSIYGSRAASGAILITTKKGKSGATKVSFNMQTGWSQVSRFVDLLNTKQYLAMRHEAKINDNASILSTDYDLNGTWDTTRYTNWQKELIGRTTQYSDLQLSFSGGSEYTQFLISGGYHNENTPYALSREGSPLYNQKGSLNVHISNISKNQKLKIQFSNNYMLDVNRIPPINLANYALYLSPVAPPLYDQNGLLNWAPDSNGKSTWTNPLALLGRMAKLRTTNLITNFQLSYELFPSLFLKANTGYTNMQTDEVSTGPSFVVAPEKRLTANRSGIFNNAYINSWILEPQINYNHVYVFGTLDAIIGGTLQQNFSNRRGFRVTGYTSDQVLQNPNAGSTVTNYGASAYVYKYNALFGLLNYSYKNRYNANFSIRRDGSSRFGENNLFHNFWSIAGAWVFSNESFFRKVKPVFSQGKLRISYGTTGNDQIGDYQFLNLYNPFNTDVNYQNVVGYTPAGLPNPNLKWESTNKLQLGTDLGFLNSRMLLNFNYYLNKSSNQLVSYTLPITTGFGSVVRNFPATVQNTGFEISLKTVNVSLNKFSWITNVNMTIPRNKLISFPNLSNTSYSDNFIIGKSLNVIRLYHFLGVDPITGLFSYQGKDGKPTSNPDFSNDRTIWIDTSPKFFGGIQNSFTYNGIQLDILLQFSSQIGQNYKMGNRPGFFSSNLGNQPTVVLEKGMHSRYSTTYNGDAGDAYFPITDSDFYYSSASYLRIKNISLSWQVPESWIKKVKMSSCRLYAHAQNVLTFTKYVGIDPETRNPNSLPPLRVLTIGIQAGL